MVVKGEMRVLVGIVYIMNVTTKNSFMGHHVGRM